MKIPRWKRRQWETEDKLCDLDQGYVLPDEDRQPGDPVARGSGIGKLKEPVARETGGLRKISESDLAKVLK